MPEHTPGPWEIDWFICHNEEGGEAWRVPTAIGPATVDHNHWAGWHIDVEPADAVLMNAALELLTALENIVGSTRYRQVFYCTCATLKNYTCFHCAALAAIAKAKGESEGNHAS